MQLCFSPAQGLLVSRNIRLCRKSSGKNKRYKEYSLCIREKKGSRMSCYTLKLRVLNINGPEMSLNYVKSWSVLKDLTGAKAHKNVNIAWQES